MKQTVPMLPLAVPGLGIARLPRSRFTKQGPGRMDRFDVARARPNFDPAVHDASKRVLPIPGGWR